LRPVVVDMDALEQIRKILLDFRLTVERSLVGDINRIGGKDTGHLGSIIAFKGRGELFSELV
jgi:hypothetical protein